MSFDVSADEPSLRRSLAARRACVLYLHPRPRRQLELYGIRGFSLGSRGETP